MNEAEFLQRYSDTLMVIEDTIEELDDSAGEELDYETVNDILTLTCSNSSVIIITRQSVTSQLWVAAKSGGFHFNFDEALQQWLCTLDKKPLAEMLADICLQQGQVTVSFSEI